MKKIRNFLSILQLIFKRRFYGFVQGHFYLDSSQTAALLNLLNDETGESSQVVSEFEDGFSTLVGDGKSVSFAAARMAFYSLMKVLNIGEGDEVIIQAANCSVMVNAILRLRATPVFVDIDSDTLGSSAENIRDQITYRTKMIVAQHSFGIPCRIQPIVELAKSNSIFLLEDCALTLGSSISGVGVGNFGDAAIFSTDHSKPINTFIGGFLYTKDNALCAKVRSYRDTLEDLASEHQERLFKQIMFERRYFTPEKLGLGNLINYLRVVSIKLGVLKLATPILTDDYVIPNDGRANYPYPAKLPAFLAKLGLFELNRWNKELQDRIKLFKRYLDLFRDKRFQSYLPKIYFDPSVKIVPLRFVFRCPDAKSLRNKLAVNFDVQGYWFLQPLVACINPADFGYKMGSCPEAESLGEDIINFPCTLEHTYDTDIIEDLKNILSDLD